MSSRIHHCLIALALTVLSGCSSMPATRSDTSSTGVANAPLTTDNFAKKLEKDVQSSDSGKDAGTYVGDESRFEPPKPEIQVGTGKFINEGAARRPVAAPGGEGQVDFNFENNPIQAVVKAILGDLLQQNYTIAPNVGGNVSFSTANRYAPIRPVGP